MSEFLRIVLVVLRKELIDAARDRRSMSAALLYPLFGPLMMVGIFSIVAQLESASDDLVIPMAGRERAPELVAFLVDAGVEVVDAPPDPRESVAAGEHEVVIVVADDFADDLAHARPAELHVVVDGSRNDSGPAIARTHALLNAFNGRLATQRLLVRGVSPAVATPIVVEEIEVASEQQIAARALAFVPMFVLLAAFVGGLQVAIDTTAGERERGSLEPLLINPVSTDALVTGKWLAASVFATGSIALTLASCVFALVVSPTDELGLRVAVGPLVITGLFAATVPLGVFASAVQVLVAAFARNFKEAQTYASLLILVPMVPSMIASLVPIGSEWWYVLVPVLAQVVVLTEVMGGEFVSVLSFLLAGVMPIVGGVAAAWLAGRFLARDPAAG